MQLAFSLCNTGKVKLATATDQWPKSTGSISITPYIYSLNRDEVLTGIFTAKEWWQ